jgi:hypothetical protein
MQPHRKLTLLSTLLGNQEPLPGDFVWHEEGPNKTDRPDALLSRRVSAAPRLMQLGRRLRETTMNAIKFGAGGNACRCTP